MLFRLIHSDCGRWRFAGKVLTLMTWVYMFTGITKMHRQPETQVRKHRHGSYGAWT